MGRGPSDRPPLERLRAKRSPVYANCMFCRRHLGSNQVIETFPVGRRLAFDEARGRLWVVCRKCARWNLTPLEERWEAVEACERLFRGTRVRTSTENIGLARHPEGLELVRIGRPLRPEFAAWRYGRQFVRRWRWNLGLGALTGTLVVAKVVGGALATPAAFVGAYGLYQVARRFAGMPPSSSTARRNDGSWLKLDHESCSTARILPATAEPGFALEFAKDPGFSLRRRHKWEPILLEGEEARRFAAVILPSLNDTGGRPRTVRDAVAEIEALGHPSAFVADVAKRDRYWRRGVLGYIDKMPKPTRLALEMALREEEERRALEGELWRLERAWRDAEEIAAIADDLLVPDRTKGFLRRHRKDGAD